MKYRTKKEITAWLMMAPNALGLIAFTFVPMISALYTSFCDYGGITTKTFIGVQNYIEAFHDKLFLHSLMVTFKYSLMIVSVTCLFALLFALLIHAMKRPWNEIARTLIFMPFCISSVISGFLWGFMFNVKTGYINDLIAMLGGEKQKFFASPDQALVCIVITSLWIGIGYSMTIVLSALNDIPAEYYEAASIDGAGTLASFFYITLPGLKNAMTFILISSTISSFQVYDQVNIITHGGPNRATEVAVYYIVKTAFVDMKVGYATSLSVILFLILFAFSLIQLRIMMKRTMDWGEE